MASPTSLISPTTSPKSLPPIVKSKFITTTTAVVASAPPNVTRRCIISLSAAALLASPFPQAARATSEEEYKKETEEVIEKVRSTINLDKNDPKIAEAVAELREASNSWVAKYRREKTLLGRSSFRDIYSALNAVSGHYISFGPTAPIPAKRKQRILEEMETAEKALQRGR